MSKARSIAEFLAITPVPELPPELPPVLLERITAEVEPDEAPFLTHLPSNLRLDWLEPAIDRLGSTNFEYTPNELHRRKRLRLPPGVVTISLHPVLVDDEVLMLHTLVHELLHAAGIIDHGSRHDEIVARIAPAPKLSESPLLRYLQAGVIAASDELSWECEDCNFVWTRDKVRKPLRCPSCARLL